LILNDIIFQRISRPRLAAAQHNHDDGHLDYSQWQIAENHVACAKHTLEKPAAGQAMTLKQNPLHAAEPKQDERVRPVEGPR
jgi:hypothetical protein